MSFSPLWNEWHIKELLGRGTFGAVYKAEKNEYGNRYYSAIKHLSIPPANVTKESLIADGIATDEKSLIMYCNTLRDQIINEINVCYKLRGNTNIVSYEDHCIIPKKDGIGYDVFIRMELLTGLTSYMVNNPLSENDVIRLGSELCEALSVLDMNHMIHRDIKPANIFVNSNGVFKLGDFGESKVLSNSNMGMTIRGTYSYISPEISKGQPANITADIYSLGLVMYRLLNGNRAPFLSPSGQPVDSIQTENANIRRLKGEPLPLPEYCNNTALASVVLKACAYNKEDRWQSPGQMKQALASVLAAQSVQYGVTVNVQQTHSGSMRTPPPSQAPAPQPIKQAPPPIMQPSMQPASYSFQSMQQSMQPMQQSMQQQYAPQSGSKKKLGLIIGLSAGAVALIVAVVLIIVLNVNNDSGSSVVGTWSFGNNGTISAEFVLQSGGTGYFVYKNVSTGEIEDYESITWSESGDTVTLSDSRGSVSFIHENNRLYSSDKTSYFEKISSSTYVPEE